MKNKARTQGKIQRSTTKNSQNTLETYWFAHNHTVVNRMISIAKITENVHTGLKIKICVAYEILLKHKD